METQQEEDDKELSEMRKQKVSEKEERQKWEEENRSKVLNSKEKKNRLLLEKLVIFRGVHGRRL